MSWVTGSFAGKGFWLCRPGHDSHAEPKPGNLTAWLQCPQFHRVKCFTLGLIKNGRLWSMWHAHNKHTTWHRSHLQIVALIQNNSCCGLAVRIRSQSYRLNGPLTEITGVWQILWTRQWTRLWSGSEEKGTTASRTWTGPSANFSCAVFRINKHVHRLGEQKQF